MLNDSELHSLVKDELVDYQRAKQSCYAVINKLSGLMLTCRKKITFRSKAAASAMRNELVYKITKQLYEQKTGDRVRTNWSTGHTYQYPQVFDQITAKVLSYTEIRELA